MTLGLGYQSEKEDGYLLFCPEPKFIAFGEGCDFEEKGNAWKILKNEKEDPGDAFSLLFCSDVRLDSLRGRVVTKKDCFCFADGAHFSCGVFRNGRLLCAIPEGKEALLVKEVTL